MKKQLIFFAMLLAGMTLAAQNPYLETVNNEDEVVHLEQWQRHAAVPLQVIVKLQDYSSFTIEVKGGERANVKNERVPCPAIQAALDSFLVESVEQLCPTFVMPREPRRSASYGGGEVRDHDLSQLYLITLAADSPKREYELIEKLSALPEVEYAEPNYLCFALGEAQLGMRNYELGIADATAVADNSSLLIPNSSLKSGSATPNDPMYSLQWGIAACGIDSLLTAPKRDTSWRPIIAIIDTGVDIDHSDLSDNIWTNSAEANGAANQDDDGNGFRDDVHGWDFVNQTAEMHDFNSHGTHCAGIAGAVTNNGIGIAGACPDALIMPVTVMQSDGTGDIATIVQGINYARQNGADVISMSIGTYAYSTALEQALAVAYQTAVIVAAAGNDHYHIQQKICKESKCGPMFPGAFTFVLGVQATGQTPDQSEEHNGMLASFSNIDNDGGPSASTF
ncbi:MAG: S8 family serine peptidase, partial [Bacteroidales bacterium]|nr:S8 family serine peptidase [Bacteroidales bacterium]